MSRTMSDVKSNYDVDPRKPVLPVLVGIIQNLNRQLEVASKKLTNLQEESRKVDDEAQMIKRRYQTLLRVLMCESSQSVLESTPKGKTFALCLKCSRKQDRETQLADALSKVEEELQRLKIEKRE